MIWALKMEGNFGKNLGSAVIFQKWRKDKYKRGMAIRGVSMYVYMQERESTHTYVNFQGENQGLL